MVNALLSQLFLECVAGLNDRKGCIFTNDMKLTRQNMKYFVFILSAMKYATQAHWKYVSLHTFLQQRNYVPCSTFRGSFKVKCPESGAKTHV